MSCTSSVLDAFTLSPTLSVHFAIIFSAEFIRSIRDPFRITMYALLLFIGFAST